MFSLSIASEKKQSTDALLAPFDVPSDTIQITQFNDLKIIFTHLACEQV